MVSQVKQSMSNENSFEPEYGGDACVAPALSVIIRDLAYFCTENHLKSLIETEVGPCAKVFIPKNKETSRSLLYAFAEFESVQLVNRACELLNGKLFMGRRLKVQSCEEATLVRPHIPTNVSGPQIHFMFEGLRKLV
jgi:RNA recognition motif-containing protein